MQCQRKGEELVLNTQAGSFSKGFIRAIYHQVLQEYYSYKSDKLRNFLHAYLSINLKQRLNRVHMDVGMSIGPWK